MAKILLVDFTQADKDRLVSEKYDVDSRQTGWMTGLDNPLDLPGDSEVVFYQIGGETAAGRPDLHAEFHEALPNGSGKAPGSSASSAAARRPG